MNLAIWLTHKTVPCWHLTPAQAARLQQALPGVAVTVCADEAAFLAALPLAEAAVVWHFNAGWLSLAPRLRWIATPAAGRDYFQIPAAANVTVTYGHFHGELMAETVLGMLLATSRGILDAQRRQLAGEAWPRAELGAIVRPLRGSHVVILGFGAIGQWVGRLAKPFGVRLTGVRRSPMPRPPWFEPADAVTTVEHLDALLPAADHLVLTLPGDTGTGKILDERRLRLLPPHAWLYNVGRGNALDEAALAAALGEQRLAGACLDVFVQEPLPADSPLRRAPNLLLLPHVSAVGANYLDLYLAEFIALCRARQDATP